MRFRARLVLGLFGMALAVPAVVMAGPVGDDEPMPGATGMQAPPQAQAEPHHHKGLFGRRHCVECQRAYVKAHDGVDIPAPPPIDAGGAQGQVIVGAHCPTCQGEHGRVGTGREPRLTRSRICGGRRLWRSRRPDAPGYAVVGEAIVGSEPAPIGVAKAHTHGATDPRMAAMGGSSRRGTVDPSVVPDQSAACPGRPGGTGTSTGPTSSATCSDCRFLVKAGANGKKRSGRSTPRSLMGR